MSRILTVSPNQPGAYPTIRDALEVAADDEVISIAPGTYREALRLERRRSSLSCAGETGAVVVDAEAAAHPARGGWEPDITVQRLVPRGGEAPGARGARAP